NKMSQATGLGITGNIIDCYAAVLRMWQPGDRIFLFGFSRGAYTVRCLGGVLALCGVPTRMRDGTGLKRDLRSAKAIAKEAVKQVYQHVSSPRDAAHVEQRVALSRRFRAQYGSGDDERANAYPYFIGVFDTVAALGSYRTFALLAAAFVGAIAAASFGVSLVLCTFLPIFLFTLGAAGVLAACLYLLKHIKFARGLEGYSLWQTLHLAAPRMKFYDRQLNENVRFARHALSIDENRTDFMRVEWAQLKARGLPRQGGEPEWLEQVWFAGIHSDIGGSYNENESRLSDIALKWMVESAQAVPDGIELDCSLLRLYPSAAGIQHDERKSGRFSSLWTLGLRPIRTDAPLDPSVLERFALEGVIHFDETKPYRPAGLREHQAVKHFYESVDGVGHQ
ncbi:MAG: phospholipase effector Tle1 domain-containing protein, partial [Terriglobia bacterium]